MRPTLVQYVCCPGCGGSLHLECLQEDGGRVREGLLDCATCGRRYPVVRYVPRFVAPQFYDPGDFFSRYGLQAPALPSRADGAPAQQKTAEYFGFEWKTFHRFGWDDAIFNLDHERQVFEYKSLMDQADLTRQLVLDAGCGNGRYSYWANRLGATVIAVDLGQGVEAAFDNTREQAGIHVLQADLFQLPFRPATFDRIFSIGVLMHTGDARRAMGELVGRLKPGGSITVHLYHKGNLLYELNDRWLRALTTRLGPRTLLRLSQGVAPFLRLLQTLRLLKLVDVFVRLPSWHPHIIFDWYSAPYASHHTYPEVFRWCEELAIDVVHDHSPVRRSRWRMMIAPPKTVTVKAEKPKLSLPA